MVLGATVSRVEGLVAKLIVATPVLVLETAELVERRAAELVAAHFLIKHRKYKCAAQLLVAFNLIISFVLSLQQKVAKVKPLQGIQRIALKDLALACFL